MKVAAGNKIIECTGKDLNLYVFHANYDPIYKQDESELTAIEIPAPNESYAWDRLAWLLGSKDKVNYFRLDDYYPYD